MKFRKHLLILPFSLLISSFAEGSTVTVQNYDQFASPAHYNVLINSANSQMTSGFVAVGYFNGIADGSLVTSTASQLNTAFQQFGSSSTNLVFDFLNDGQFLVAGAFSLSSSMVTASPPGDAFLTKEIYFVAGNGTSFANSTEAFIYKHTGIFFPNDGAPVTSLSYLAGPTGGTKLLGNINVSFAPKWSGTGVLTGTDTNTPGTTTTIFQTVTLVPEPTTALLAAFGSLALLRRRRN